MSWLITHSFIGGLAHELAVKKSTKLHNRSLVRSANHESQDKNLVGLLDRFAKTASSHDSVDSILAHVCLYIVTQQSLIKVCTFKPSTHMVTCK